MLFGGGTGGRGRCVSSEERRRYVGLPLAQLLPTVVRPAFRKRSPAGAALMAEWASVVGPRVAADTEPRRLSRGVLTIACAGPVAMELQHLSAALIERINTWAGAPLVQSLKFIQEAPQRAAPVRRRPERPARPVEDLPPGPLNDALARLRAAIEQET